MTSGHMCAHTQGQSMRGKVAFTRHSRFGLVAVDEYERVLGHPASVWDKWSQGQCQEAGLGGPAGQVCSGNAAIFGGGAEGVGAPVAEVVRLRNKRRPHCQWTRSVSTRGKQGPGFEEEVRWL